MKLTLRFVVKSFIVIICFLFILPLMMNVLDNPENAADINYFRKRRDTLNHPNETKSFKLPVLLDDSISNKSYAIKNSVVYDSAIFKKGIIGNYEPTNLVAPGGPGDGGIAVDTSAEEKREVDLSVRRHGFNMVASDKIAMNRLVPDTRLEECKYWYYPEKLPTASVVLAFHNEGWSTLIRTVHSIINMSPKHLLKEVIMIDDFSTNEELFKPLDEYILRFNGLVKVYRNDKRLGLILTKTLGAKYSTGDAVVFLDAHCECNKNWLTPLLARIAQNRKTMAVPIVDGINWNDFKYRPVYQQNAHFRGIFAWQFLYKESRVPEKELNKRKYNSEPYWSPTHAGGLFAMDRIYFLELGAYDPGLRIWGGENFELSFKIWMCGGVVEWVPCSRVGHVYRNHMPYNFGDAGKDLKISVVLNNYLRVVEVWLDEEFKNYFYTMEPSAKGYPVANISDQIEFRKKHGIHDFKWFMDNVAYEVYEKFPPPPPNAAWGNFKLRRSNEGLCWDTMGHQPGQSIGMSGCHQYGGNQLFRLNVHGQIGVGERCVVAQNGKLEMAYCDVSPSGPWLYDEIKGLLTHKNSNRCVYLDQYSLKLADCDSSNPLQQWQVVPFKVSWQS